MSLLYYSTTGGRKFWCSVIKSLTNVVDTQIPALKSSLVNVHEWTRMTYTILEAAKNTDFAIDSRYTEILVEYGSNNNGQAYGGGSYHTVVPKGISPSKPSFLPLFLDTSSTAPIGIVYFYFRAVDGTNKLQIANYCNRAISCHIFVR